MFADDDIGLLDKRLIVKFLSLVQKYAMDTDDVDSFSSEPELFKGVLHLY